MSDVSTATGPQLPDAQMNLVRPTDPCIGRITGTTLCTAGKSQSFIRHVEIDVSGTPLAGNFHAGQSFGVIPPGEDEKGKPHKVRLYSVASPSWGEDGKGQVVSTTPKRLLEEMVTTDESGNARHGLYLGVASNYLCDLNVGDEVKLSGPSGKRFLLPVDREEHDYLFVATGTGVAPFRGMAMELFDGPNGPTKSQVHLVMGAPYKTDLVYDELFTRLNADHDNFHYHTAISREIRSGGRRGHYVHQFIEEELDQFRPLFDNPRTLIYICGVIGMQIGLFSLLARTGLGGKYLTVKEPMQEIDPADWQADQVKRYVRPTHNCMVEVY